MKILSNLNSLDNILDGETRKIPTKTSDLTNDNSFFPTYYINDNSSENPFIVTENEIGVYIFKPTTTNPYIKLNSETSTTRQMNFRVLTIFNNAPSNTEEFGYCEYPNSSGISRLTLIANSSYNGGISWSGIDSSFSSYYQLKSNLTTSLSSSSTDAQYPSAKCVYDAINDISSNINTYYLTNILNMTSTSDATYEIVNDLINNNQFVILDDPDGRFREMFYYVPIKTYAESGQTMQKFWYIDNQDKYNLVVITHSGTSVTVIRTTYHSIEEAYNLANGKQDALVSGTNIKTINNESILGSGNIEISGSGNVQELSSDFRAYDLEEGFYRTSSSVVIWYHDDGTVYQDTLPAWTRLNVFRTIEPGDNEQYSAIWHLYIEVYAPTSESIRKNIYYECSYRDITSGEHYLGYGTKYSIIPTTDVRTNVKINGTSITSNNVANIATEGTYNSSSNKIVTKSYVDNIVGDIETLLGGI